MYYNFPLFNILNPIFLSLKMHQQIFLFLFLHSQRFLLILYYLLIHKYRKIFIMLFRQFIYLYFHKFYQRNNYKHHKKGSKGLNTKLQ